MSTLKIQDQGTIKLSQMDYLPILIESFLVDRRAQGLSAETHSSAALLKPLMQQSPNKV